MLKGAANNGSGRRWKGNVYFVTNLIGAMRSISSHWKRGDFDEQEADLESELLTRTEEGDLASPLDNAVSHARLERPSIFGGKRQFHSVIQLHAWCRFRN
jgi:hypothetical protein